MLARARHVTLASLVLLSGCPGGSSGGAPPVTVVAAPAIEDEAAALRAGPEAQASLEALAQDRSRRASLRLAALRRLEELAPPSATAVAEKLALDGTRNADAALLRKNSVALLVRARTPQGQAALARVKAQDLDLAVLAARLEKGE